MDMRLQELLAAHLDTTALDRERLPEIGLYMDQVLTLLETALEPGRRGAGEKLLTKMMINNYTKAGLLQKPQGKKYSRAHLMMLVLIHQLKETLSIEEIGTLLGLCPEALLAADGGYDEEAVAACFDAFVRMKEVQAGLAEGVAQNAEQALAGCDAQQELLLTVLYLSNLARMATLTAEKLLDSAVLEAEKKAEKIAENF